MYDFENAAISARFFEAIDYLKEAKTIGGLTPFCERYGLNRRNVMQQRANPMRQILRPAWLAHLVADYNVNADWLLTGKGQILRLSEEKREKCVQEISERLATLL